MTTILEKDATNEKDIEEEEEKSNHNIVMILRTNDWKCFELLSYAGHDYRGSQ